MNCSKHTIRLAIFTLFLLCSLGIQGQQLKEASIRFRFLKKNVTGSVSGFQSNSKIDWQQPENSLIAGSVDANTLKTGNFLRDWSLKSERYFHVDTYPRMRFKSTQVEIKNDTIQIDGILTIKGISKTIDFTLTRKGPILTGTTTLRSSDFDIHIYKNDAEANTVEVDFEFILE